MSAISRNKTQITVVGCGYVGLTTASCLADLGHLVVGVDASLERLNLLEVGKVPFFEPGLDDLVNSGLHSGNLKFTKNLEHAVSESQFVFLCVPTPSLENGSADLSIIYSVSKEMKDALPSGSVVVIKSTVPVGTSSQVSDWISRPDVEVVSNPEFLQAGRAISAFQNPDRIVIGARTADAKERVSNLYTGLNSKILCTDPSSAELIKYASNTYLASRLTFVNTIAELCEKTQGDATTVLQGMGLDKRIGEAFLQPGPGWGGSCFPKDTQALIAVASEAGSDSAFLSAVLESNEARFTQIAKVVTQSLGDDSGKKIAMLGLAFKAGTDDIRESPSLKIASLLLESGVKVVGYDPQVNMAPLQGLEMADSPEDAAKEADALLVLTEWKGFLGLDLPKLYQSMTGNLFIDTRNVFDKKDLVDAGFSVWRAGEGWI